MPKIHISALEGDNKWNQNVNNGGSKGGKNQGVSK